MWFVLRDVRWVPVKTFSHSLVLLVLLLVSAWAAAAEPLQVRLEFQNSDRLLVLAPHPDDEVIGCAGTIQQAKAAGVPVKILFLTYGDNNQWAFTVYRLHPVLVPGALRAMGEIRHGEALAAAKLLGMSDSDLIFLGYPDFRTLAIWLQHWESEPPCAGMLNRARAVPYPDAFRPGAPYKGEEIVSDLTTVLKTFKPTKLLVPHPADHNPDHQALYLFAKVALWTCMPSNAPPVFPYLVHYPAWPRAGLHLAEPLPPPSYLTESCKWIALPLAPAEVEAKLAALKCHRTQYLASARYLNSFVRTNELFGDMPVLDLSGLAGTNRSAIVSRSPGEAVDPALLTDDERAQFVGIEERRVSREGDALVISVSHSRPLTEAVSLSVYAFGYRDDKPFGKMPKIHVKVGPVAHKVLDQKAVLAGDACTVERGLKRVVVKIPLRILGEPSYVFTGARTYLGGVPLDTVAWRICDFTRRDELALISSDNGH